MTGINGCETNQCTACNCSCTESGGHKCTECSICKSNDDHTRKE